jgi:tRNA (guanine-N7-)-methyltransferase
VLLLYFACCPQLVDRANKWAETLDYHKEVHFVFTNATVSLANLLSTYPGPLVRLCVQFPDPHFKKRHKKRRIIQPGVVQAVKQLLVPGGGEGRGVGGERGGGE